MKQALCKEFCDQLTVRKVPAGLAVGTSYIGLSGDPIGFYIVGPEPKAAGRYRIEDDGATVPILEACGADLAIESRAAAFRELLDQYDVQYDEDSGELKTDLLLESEIPRAAFRFVAFMLRVQDLMLLTRDRAENTFRQEALRDLEETIGDSAKIEFDQLISNEIDIAADVIIRAPQRAPIALFLVMQDSKLYEAMLLHTEATLKAHMPVKVIALLEDVTSVSKKTFKQALNRITPLHYRGDEKTAMQRIKSEALDGNRFLH